ncbi:MAG: 50S ribosomal protein L28 [Firmicutes bacterium]|nr:50S ribosomal protein L28 [Bacillota bacterium]MBQ7241625.1 50S ribosomal protein L28 [Bacillota bacterium]MBR0103985.1 50S ribosomal protein L28 [Bacillota bacterium]MBR2594507.1 50S ribosomal protein L28 [Bacillota bacterium]
MAKCEICEKSQRTGHRISISRSQVSRRANRRWKPNLKKVKVIENGTVKSMYVCTRCLRSNKVTRAI